MKVPLSTAAAGALAVRPVPITTVSPAPSMSSTASVAVRDHGSCAPISAQPIPSSRRCLARCRTAAGTSTSDSSATQVASFPVGPEGAVAGSCVVTVTATPKDVLLLYLYNNTSSTARIESNAPYAWGLMSVHDFRPAPEAVAAGAGVPLHRQLFLVLHDEIARGALRRVNSLPTEQALCDQFGVSRITVRRALADLADAGLIERRQGVGSFVRDRPPSRRNAGWWVVYGRAAQNRVRDRCGRASNSTSGKRPEGVADELGRRAGAARAAAAA